MFAKKKAENSFRTASPGAVPTLVSPFERGNLGYKFETGCLKLKEESMWTPFDVGLRSTWPRKQMLWAARRCWAKRL